MKIDCCGGNQKLFMGEIICGYSYENRFAILTSWYLELSPIDQFLL